MTSSDVSGAAELLLLCPGPPGSPGRRYWAVIGVLPMSQVSQLRHRKRAQGLLCGQSAIVLINGQISTSGDKMTFLVLSLPAVKLLWGKNKEIRLHLRI